jgi:hypothetical protein
MEVRAAARQTDGIKVDVLVRIEILPRIILDCFGCKYIHSYISEPGLISFGLEKPTIKERAYCGQAHYPVPYIV